MSLLLERLGRPAGEPIQQKTIFGRRQAEAKEDNYQELKLAIHRRIVDEMSDKTNYFQISATIFCEKPSHKNIIVGAKGQMLKEIGTSSRIAIEKGSG